MPATKKLNLGCGTKCIDDWINVDNSINARLSAIPGMRYLLWKTGLISKQSFERKFENKKIRFFDITRRFPYEDASIDHIYSSHTFEHLFHDKALDTSRECHRVLKPNGILRIVVPDLYDAITKYVEEYRRKISSYEAGKFDAIFHHDINRLYHTDAKLFDHKYMYDYISLSQLMYRAGFRVIRKAKALESGIPGIDEIEKRIDDSGNLYVECTKM
jgi:predicted SAM-dependent methyltransferase